MSDDFKDPMAEKIIQSAFVKNDWRTLQGIATASGLNYDQVRGYVQSHPNIFVSSSLTLSGSAVYKVSESVRNRILTRS